jgi:glucose-6-phosphate 1-dehydrogenase
VTAPTRSDALVFFGATGDLAYKQIFPALQAMIRRGVLEAQWRVVEPVLDLPTQPLPYELGTWGPGEANRLVAEVPGGWRRPIDPSASS